MNSTKTQKYVFYTILALLSAFSFAEKSNAGSLKFDDVFLEREFAGNVVFSDCEQTKKLAAEAIDKIIVRDFEGVRKNFDENMKQSLSAEQLKAGWMVVIGERGEYKSREKALYQEYPDNAAVFTALQMEKGKVVIEIRFGVDGKIGGLWLRPA